LAIFYLLFFITLEALRQYSERNNGLIIYKTVAEMPTIISVAYIYVPVSLAVLAVTLWKFFISDALRLESYFQLARSEGVPATILFTNYSFCYGVMAPLVAARNRHWLILSVSSLSIVFSALLPSLLSGLVVLTEASLNQTKTVSTWPKLLEEGTQKNWFVAEARRYTNAPVMTTADDFFLLRSSEYATASVLMPLDENETSILSLNQTVYWGELTCQDAALDSITLERRLSTDIEKELDSGSLQMRGTTSFEFPSSGNDHPCRVDFTLNITTPAYSSSSQVRYWEPIRPQSAVGNDSAFQTTDCERYALVGLLIDINEDAEKATDHVSNATAFACTATYRLAEAELSIDVNTSIVEARIDSSSQRDLREMEFSSSGFQNLLYHESRGPINSASQVLEDVTNVSVSPRSLFSSGLNLGLVPESFSARTGVPEYQNAIMQFWKSRFIITINKFFDTAAAATPLKASQVTVVVALDVLSTPAIMAEILLVTTAIVLMSLAAVYPRRANFLRSDPGSIAAQCALIADLFTADNPLTQSSEKFSKATSRQLLLWARNFRCEWTDLSSDKKIDIVPIPSNSSFALPSARRSTDRRPHFVVLPWFLMECILLIGILVTYGFALNFTSFQNVDTESSQQLGLMIFLLFGPTLIASLVSSLLASILRNLSIIEPWGRLQKGRSPVGMSLAMNYGSQTPITVFFRSLCRGPLLLTALSIICTLSLLLSIVSGGMFEPETKHYHTPATGLSSQYNGTLFQLPNLDVQFDGNGLVLSRMNRVTPIIPWQYANYSFLPLTNSKLGADTAQNVKYAAVTTGIGANLDCQQALYNQSWIDHESGKMSWNYTSPSGLTCTMEAPNRRVEDGLLKRSISYLQPSEESSARSRCEASFLILARWETLASSPMNQQNSLALYCEPSMASEEFEVVFDPQGIISSYEPKADLTAHGQQAAHNLPQGSLAHFNRAIMAFGKIDNPQWNVSFSHYDWLGMLTEVIYDRLHPSARPSFDPAMFLRAAQSTYQQIFSTYLTLNRDMYFRRYPESAAPAVEGTVIASLWGLFPSIPSMVIALVLLSLDIMMLTVVFATRFTYFRAPRIPKSIGSLIPWIAESEMIPDFRGMSRIEKSEWQGIMERTNKFYRFALTRCPDGHERWLLDYEHISIQEDGNDLTEMPDITPVRTLHRGQSLPAQSIRDLAVTPPNQPP
jgi:hypothetical protein